MEHANDLDFVKRLQAAAIHEVLYGNQEKQNEIVPVDERDGKPFGDGQRAEDRHRKDAAHRLLITEMKQLQKCAAIKVLAPYRYSRPIRLFRLHARLL